MLMCLLNRSRNRPSCRSIYALYKELKILSLKYNKKTLIGGSYEANLLPIRLCHSLKCCKSIRAGKRMEKNIRYILRTINKLEEVAPDTDTEPACNLAIRVYAKILEI